MLTLAGEPMGALAAYYRGRVVPDARELELVELYARQAAEMVERARLHAEARSLAALERRRGEQLRQLADAALALSAAQTLDELLRLVTEAAREVIGCHQGVGEPAAQRLDRRDDVRLAVRALRAAGGPTTSCPRASAS